MILGHRKCAITLCMVLLAGAVSFVVAGDIMAGVKDFLGPIPGYIHINFGTTTVLEESPDDAGLMGVTFLFDLQPKFYTPLSKNPMLDMSTFILDAMYMDIPALDSLKLVYPKLIMKLVEYSYDNVDDVPLAAATNHVIFAPDTSFRTLQSTIGSGTNTISTGYAELQNGIKNKSYIWVSPDSNAIRSVVRFRLFLRFMDETSGHAVPVSFSQMGIDYFTVKMRLKGTFTVGNLVK